MLSLLVAASLVTLYPMQVGAADNASLEQNRSELQQMQNDAQTLDAQLQSTMAQARQLETQISDMLYRSGELNKQIADTKQQIADRNKIFKERVRVMYTDGTSSYLSVLLNSKDFSDFIDRFDMLTIIARHDKQLFDQLNADYAKLKTQQTQLIAEQQEQEKKQQQLLALENDLQAKLRDKQSQISQVQQTIQQEEEAQREQEQQQQAQLSSRGDFTLSPSDKSAEMVATAYTASSTALTATGTRAGMGTVAVDPNVIPLGTKLYIEGYGYGVATDTGLDIKGNRIDLYFNSIDQCIMFGRQVVKVTLLK